MCGWRISCGAATVVLAVAACGGSGAAPRARVAAGRFPVQVARASFPASQRLAERSRFVISVRNAGSKAIPNIAVTILNPRYGTAAAAFATLIAQPSAGQPILASRSRPVWVVDRAPGPCQYSCKQGGPGGAATAYSNTWALGRLPPGRTASFVWGVTAVKAGTYTVEYEVAAGLNGNAKAVSVGGGGAVSGSFRVTISSRPRRAYVNNDGKIVYTHTAP